jgi:hypothetical protein
LLEGKEAQVSAIESSAEQSRSPRLCSGKFEKQVASQWSVQLGTCLGYFWCIGLQSWPSAAGFSKYVLINFNSHRASRKARAAVVNGGCKVGKPGFHPFVAAKQNNPLAHSPGM